MSYSSLKSSSCCFCLLLLMAACTGPSKTIKNLKEASARELGESLSYTLYAQKAQQEGLRNLETLFSAAAFSQQAHANLYIHLLSEWNVADYTPDDVTVGKVGSTLENLNALIMARHYEVDSIYPLYIATAVKEKADSAVLAFTRVRQAKQRNVAYYRSIMKQLNSFMETTRKVSGMDSVMAVSMNDNLPVFCSLCPVCGSLYNDMVGTDTFCLVCHTPASQFDHFPRH